MRIRKHATHLLYASFAHLREGRAEGIAYCESYNDIRYETYCAVLGAILEWRGEETRQIPIITVDRVASRCKTEVTSTLV